MTPARPSQQPAVAPPTRRSSERRLRPDLTTQNSFNDADDTNDSDHRPPKPCVPHEPCAVRCPAVTGSRLQCYKLYVALTLPWSSTSNLACLDCSGQGSHCRRTSLKDRLYPATNFIHLYFLTTIAHAQVSIPRPVADSRSRITPVCDARDASPATQRDRHLHRPWCF